jgi:hypothetical protein
LQINTPFAPNITKSPSGSPYKIENFTPKEKKEKRKKGKKLTP